MCQHGFSLTHLELVPFPFQFLLHSLVALNDDCQENIDKDPVDTDRKEEEHHSCHCARFFKFAKFEFVQHHCETSFKCSDQCFKIVELAVEDEIKHLNKSSKSHKENAKKAGEISPAPGKGVNEQRHLVVELEDLQEFDVGKEDE